MISIVYWLCMLSTTVHAYSKPDTVSCCRRAGVTDSCANQFCDPNKTPDGFAIFKLSSGAECNEYTGVMARCLTDGRNSTRCCSAELQKKRDYVKNSVCLDWCDGTAIPLSNNGAYGEDDCTYLQCLSWNAEIIYSCARDSYAQTPGPPRDVAVNALSAQSATVFWNAPQQFPDLVRQYSVIYGYSHMNPNTYESVECEDRRITLYNLNPDTKYTVYVVAKTRDGARASVKSAQVHFVTEGVSPTVHSYRNRVHAAARTHATLVCRVIVQGFEHHVQIDWQRKDRRSKQFVALRNDAAGSDHRFAHKSYKTAQRSSLGRTFISTLTIKNINEDDYGKYRCITHNEFGSGYANIRLQRQHTVEMPTKPPNMTECCLQTGIPLHCCRQFSGMRAPSASNIDFTCIAESPRILQCSMRRVDAGACCLRHKVPDDCLAVCGGSVLPGSPRPPSMLNCLQNLSHRFSALKCYQETQKFIPNAPYSVEIAEQTDNPVSALIRWRADDKAVSYLVFYREVAGGGDWRREMVHERKVRLTSLNDNSQYQLVVLAANEAGHSTSSRELRVLTGDRRHDPLAASQYNMPNAAASISNAAGHMQELAQHDV